MAWPFLTDILRRKLWCSGPSAPVPQRGALPTGHRSELGSSHINTFPSSFPFSLTYFSIELTLRSKCTCRLLSFPFRYLSVHIIPLSLHSCLLFCSHHCLFSTISIFSIISIHFPFLSTHHISYFPHLLVIVLYVNHLPNNCRYSPDM